jgi:hypothetical protein
MVGRRLTRCAAQPRGRAVTAGRGVSLEERQQAVRMYPVTSGATAG